MLKKLTLITAIIALACAIAAGALIPFAIGQQNEQWYRDSAQYAEFRPVADFEWGEADTLTVDGYYYYQLLPSQDELLHVESNNYEIGDTQAQLGRLQDGWRLDIRQERGWIFGRKELQKLTGRAYHNNRTNTVRIYLPDSIRQVEFTGYAVVQTDPFLDQVQVRVGVYEEEMVESSLEETGEQEIGTWEYSIGELSGSQTLDLDFSTQGIDSVTVNNQVGDVTVLPSSDDRLYLEVSREDRWLGNDGISADDTRLTVRNEDGVLRLTIEGPEALHLENWVDRAGNMYRNVNLYLRVPPELERLEVSQNVGNILVENMDAVFYLHSNVGELTVRDSALQSGSVLDTDLGNISVWDGILYGRQRLRTNVGEVSLDITVEPDCRLHIQANLGDVNLTLEGSGWRVTKNGSQLSGGGDESAVIDVNNNLGNVTVTGNAATD